MTRASPAAKRYVWRLLATMTVYVVALIGSNLAERAWHPEGAALIALAVLPALPIMGVIAVIGLYLVEETDEFQRGRIVTSMMIGTGIMLSLATVHNFLSTTAYADAMPRFWAFPVWAAAWGLAQTALALRDRLRDRAGDGVQ